MVNKNTYNSRCFAHTLNLVSQKPFEEKDGIDGAKQLLTIVKDITRYCKQNINAADAIRKAQHTAAVPLKLIQSVCMHKMELHILPVRTICQAV